MSGYLDQLTAEELITYAAKKKRNHTVGDPLRGVTDL